MATKVDRLLLLYDAPSGGWDVVVDSAKKMFMLKGCPLCSITHCIAGEKKDCKRCREELRVAVDYFHRDQWGGEVEKVAHQVGLPCLLAESGGRFVPLLTPEVPELCRGGVAELRGKLHYYASTKEPDQGPGIQRGLKLIELART